MEELEVKVPKDTIWENHFDDGEKLTTVTVIEDFDTNPLETLDLPTKPPVTAKIPKPEDKKVLSLPLSRLTQSQPKKETHPSTKKKKFRYGTKAERQSDRKKLKLKKQSLSERHKKSK
jgi:hypothetical protein